VDQHNIDGQRKRTLGVDCDLFSPSLEASRSECSSGSSLPFCRGLVLEQSGATEDPFLALCTASMLGPEWHRWNGWHQCNHGSSDATPSWPLNSTRPVAYNLLESSSVGTRGGRTLDVSFNRTDKHSRHSFIHCGGMMRWTLSPRKLQQENASKKALCLFVPLIRLAAKNKDSWSREFSVDTSPRVSCKGEGPHFVARSWHFSAAVA
jgi:hypothetical protein